MSRCFMRKANPLEIITVAKPMTFHGIIVGSTLSQPHFICVQFNVSIHNFITELTETGGVR